MNRLLPILLSLAGGTLLYLGWPPLPLTPLLFVAWIPLLWIEMNTRNHWRFLMLAYLHMLTWNGLTTWWIWHASVPGAVSAIAANSLLMCLPWLGYRFIRNRKGLRVGLPALVAGWMSFEYLHLQDWGLSWPWLTLGNGLASKPDWIQWYEYTGTSGGTLWILLVNILIFLQWKQNTNPTNGTRYPYRWVALALLLLPIGFSKWIDSQLSDSSTSGKNWEVAVLQPNIDPYEKVSQYASFESQLEDLIKKSEPTISDSTALLVWPETALYRMGGIAELDLTEKAPRFDSLWAFLRRHPQLSILTGVESYAVTTISSPNSIPAPEWLRRPGQTGPIFVESYNGAALLDSTGAVQFYHKSKLVPGVETLPGFLRFLSAWFEEFGGTSGGYTPQEERTVLSSKQGLRMAPAICYESIYGEHLSRYFQKGADLLTIITNDGWWQNTPGHKQHALYAGLRAIETRRWVARSANTGISGFISPKGKWIEPQPYNTAACIRYSIPVEAGSTTFFVRTGDILSKLLCAFYIGCWIWLLVTHRRPQKS